MSMLSTDLPTHFSIFNPFYTPPKEETLPIEEWRKGWEPTGDLVGDGLPVIRLFQEKTAEFALVRPYYLIDAQNRYVLNPETQKKVITFVSPLMDWKKMYREDGSRLEPIHKQTLGSIRV